MTDPVNSTEMDGLIFEWDARKEASNRRRHRVGFAEASTVLGDPLSITIPDPDNDAGEQRFITLGLSARPRLLVVIHTNRGDRVRLISARTATRHERRSYEEASD